MRVERAALDDLAGVHHGAAVAELGHDRQVVRDEDEREAEVPAEPVEQLQDLRLHHHVERRRGLVGDQHLRVAGERHRDRRPLAHPARELVRDSARPGPPGCRPPRAARPSEPGLPPPWRVSWSSIASTICVADRAHGVERVHRTLEDDRDVHPAVRPHRLLAAGEDVILPRAGRAPETLAFGGSRPIIASAVVVLPQPDSPTSPRRSPGSSERFDALHGVQLAAAVEVEPDVQVLDLAAAARSQRVLPAADERTQPERARRQVRDAQPRVERVLERAADEAAGEDEERDQHARRDDRPPRSGGDRRPLERVLDDAAERDARSDRPGRGTPAQSRRRSRRRWSGRCSRSAAARPAAGRAGARSACGRPRAPGLA